MSMIKDLISEVPDFPKEGILFRDISPLLNNPIGFRQAIIDMVNSPFSDNASSFVALDSRGFLFAPAMASMVNGGVILCRKKGKLPPPVISQVYGLEYGEDVLEMHPAKHPGTNVIIVDDLLATGGSASAAISLAKRAGYNVVGVTCLIELSGLGGREKIEAMGIPVHTVVKY